MNLLASIMLDLADWLNSMWERLKAIAKWIKVHLVRFWENIAGFFKRTHRKYQKPHLQAISIRVNDLLKDDANFNKINIGLINAYFDTSTGTLLEDDIEIVEGYEMDADTKKSFGDKPIIIIE